MGTLALLSIVSLVLQGARAKLSEQCTNDLFPVYLGGDNGDEEARCLVYDEERDIMIVGGVTNSNDFAPAAVEHAFLMAMDSESNLKWGNFYYEVAYPLREISGCTLSKDDGLLYV